ncbi:MAG: TetR/AcrR family transcriptional regulator [Acidobacteriota bacterium]|nr:TetR/AcrR family transcriptional regulator [Acidobacteriota bacterium]
MTRQSGLRNAREAILRAAERIFAEKGLDGARTEAIAQAAHVNKAMLYYYFKSKNGLFAAVMEKAIRQSNQRIMAILSERGPATDVMLRYAATMFDALSERPYSYFLFQRFLMTNPKVVERLMRTYGVPRIRRLTALIRRGVRRKEFRPVDPEQMAVSIGSLIIFYFSTGPAIKAVMRSDPFHPGTLGKRKQEMMDFIRYGLFKNPEASTP